MKKKFLMALFFAGLLVCVPAENTVPARADTVTEKAKVKDGWVTEGNARYYYTDGKKATGFTKISGKTYFFNTKTGAQQTGFVVYGGKKYYSAPRQARRSGAGQEFKEQTIISDRRAML